MLKRFKRKPCTIFTVYGPIKTAFCALLLGFVTAFYIIFAMSSVTESEITEREAINLKHIEEKIAAVLNSQQLIKEESEKKHLKRPPVVFKDNRYERDHLKAQEDNPEGPKKYEEKSVENSKKLEKPEILEKPPEKMEKPKPKPETLSQIFCYRIRNESTLPDLLEADPPRGKSIFFHETSCKSYQNNNSIVIRSRQACAVESAALLNPNFQVYLTYLSPGIIKDDTTTSSRLLKTLQTYKNIHIVHADYERYTKDTPIENLYRERQVERSSFAISHASDIFRFVALWKYGGIYLDMDTVVLKSMENLTQNFAGVESNIYIGSGILGFDATEKGHSLMQKVLENLRDDFQGHIWAHNGPGMITRLAQKVCNTKNLLEMPTKNCGELKVYPSNVFTPLPWQHWSKYFEKKAIEEVRNKTTESYVIHLWNKLSTNRKLDVKIDVPYTILAKKFCPKVFALSDKYF